MILVDIEFSAINKKYDFKLDENTYIVELIDQIGNMIIPATEKDYEEKVKDMLLCECDKHRILELNQTLKQCGIKSGSHLVMI